MFASKDQFFTGTRGYQLTRSLRFRASATAYLNWTPASSSTAQKWTWSGWVKRGKISTGALQTIFAQRPNAGATNQTGIWVYITGSDQIDISGQSLDWLITAPVYRDPSGWYHVVLSVDTTQATASNRMSLYVNGTQVTSF